MADKNNSISSQSKAQIQKCLCTLLVISPYKMNVHIRARCGRCQRLRFLRAADIFPQLPVETADYISKKLRLAAIPTTSATYVPDKYLEGRKLDIVASWPIGSNFWFELNFLLPQLPGRIE